jgi:hypothetical protein
MNHKTPLIKSTAMHSPTLGWAFGVVVTLPLCVGSTVLAQSDATTGAVAGKPVVAKQSAPVTATQSVTPTTSTAKALCHQLPQRLRPQIPFCNLKARQLNCN